MENCKSCNRRCCTKINNISVKINNEYIIKNINIHIHCGHLTVIIGRNGAGKTTLLKALIGEINHEGSIEFIDEKDGKNKKIKIGYVPQKLGIERHNPTSVYDLFLSNITNKSLSIFKSKDAYNLVFEQLEKFEASELINKKLGELSGGELQRVLLAFATISNPQLLVLDEPVSGIDNKGTALFYKLIDKLKKEQDIAIILVSHDFNPILEYADNVILLDKEIVCEGTAKKVFESSQFKRYFSEYERGDKFASNI
ncbi:MAG: metal ABC transporter ATP-binding protein [Clostridia bacterium]|nr:metal ABC transporter ATP-binding protein [Clostridia bacterium]